MPQQLREFARPLRHNLSQTLAQQVQNMQQTPDADTDMRAFVDTLLRDACQAEASDIHLDPHVDGLAVRFRVEGVLLDVAMLNGAQAQRLINGLKTMSDIDPINAFLPQESRQTYHLDDRELDLRLAVTPCLAGEKLTLRLLDPDRATHQLHELGLASEHQQQMENWLAQATGMFLCTGPTGSGKTTTLYALLHQFKTYERSAVTVEDPVEYQIDGITQVQVDQEHGLNFPTALKSMLRHDPDYLMIGEIRDSESAHAAIDAAITGKVVMSTLHTHDALAAITALRSHGLEDQLIAAGLSFVVAQRLVPTLCPHCRTREKPSEDETTWLKTIGQSVPESTWHAPGCQHCRQLGFLDRTGVFELWQLDAYDVEKILDHANANVLRRHLVERNHQTLFVDGLAKAADGLVSLDALRQSIGVPPAGRSD